MTVVWSFYIKERQISRNEAQTAKKRIQHISTDRFKGRMLCCIKEATKTPNVVLFLLRNGIGE